MDRVKVLNSQIIQIDAEDHTMMNPLKWSISRNFAGEKVELAGYTIPHPSDDISHLNIQFCNEAAQSPAGILQKMAEGLRCIEIIGNRIASEIERHEARK